MGIILDVMGSIDAAVASYIENVFNFVSAPIANVVRACGVVGFSFIAVNTMMQFRMIRVSEYVEWSVKYILILMFATSWANFGYIYDIITNVPSEYGGAILDSVMTVPVQPIFPPGSVQEMIMIQSGMKPVGPGSTIYEQMDQFTSYVFSMANNAMHKGGITNLAPKLVGVVIAILGGFFVVAAIIILAVGKIGLALSLSLAPLFIATLIFKQTSDYFQSWSKMTAGFALIPLVMAALMGVMIALTTESLQDWLRGDADYSFSDLATFLVLLLASIFLVWQIPQIVQQLSGSMLGGINGAAKVASGVMQGYRGAKGGAMRVAAGGKEASAAKAAGGSAAQSGRAMVAGLMMNQGWRESQREKHRTDKLPGGGNDGTAGPSLTNPGAPGRASGNSQSAAQGAAQTSSARQQLAQSSAAASSGGSSSSSGSSSGGGSASSGGSSGGSASNSAAANTWAGADSSWKRPLSGSSGGASGSGGSGSSSGGGSSGGSGGGGDAGGSSGEGSGGGSAWRGSSTGGTSGTGDSGSSGEGSGFSTAGAITGLGLGLAAAEAVSPPPPPPQQNNKRAKKPKEHKGEAAPVILPLAPVQRQAPASAPRSMASTPKGVAASNGGGSGSTGNAGGQRQAREHVPAPKSMAAGPNGGTVSNGGVSTWTGQSGGQRQAAVHVPAPKSVASNGGGSGSTGQTGGQRQAREHVPAPKSMSSTPRAASGPSSGAANGTASGSSSGSASKEPGPARQESARRIPEPRSMASMSSNAPAPASQPTAPRQPIGTGATAKQSVAPVRASGTTVSAKTSTRSTPAYKAWSSGKK
jgi:type IV secretion system protein VirB6